ncbi:hypothetical protein BD560DRAFT_421616 [Blakeslea trispora]|nr:hypothetical protein BD560DRAFT_421616 [Blakeslea trispora]
MFYIGQTDLSNFLLKEDQDTSLGAFLTESRNIIVTTNCYNSWQLLRAAWTKRYKEAIKTKQLEKRKLKALCFVEDAVWKDLHQSSYTEDDTLCQSLFEWCTKKFAGIEFDSTAIVEEVKDLEKKSSKTLRDSLAIMSCKFLMTFSQLTHVQKCVLKLSVSKIINMNSDGYSREYLLYLEIGKYEELSALEAPKMMSDEEMQVIKTIFADCKKTLFNDNKPVVCDVSAGKGGQIGYILTMMKNKFAEWRLEEEEEEEEEEEDESEEEEDDEQQQSKKRKRSCALDESDVVQVVKDVLNVLFVDTLLRWKSGEKTTDSCKRMKIGTETSLSIRGSCKNVMGRRSDILLFTNKKVPVCLSEVKDGRSSRDSISQESKRIRCSKSLQVYNTCLGGSNSIWSLDWCGTCGYIYYVTSHEGVNVVLPGRKLQLPKKEEDLDKLEQTLIALYELKNFLVEYDAGLGEAFVEGHENAQIFHTP